MKISEKIALLTRDIMEKAEDEAENIIIEAENKAEVILKESRNKKIDEHRERLRNAIDELNRKKINMFSEALFQLRKDFLFKRQKIVDQVINNTMTILKNMHKDDKKRYIAIIKDYIISGLESLDSDDAYISLPVEGEKMIDEISSFCKEKNPKSNIEIIVGDHHFGPIIYSKDKRRAIDYSLNEIIKINKDIFLMLVEERLGDGNGKN